MDDLEDFLKGSEPEPTETAETQEAPEAPAPEAETAEQATARARDEKGRFAPKGETEAAPPAAAETTDVPVKALQEERRKRQELEAKLDELQRQLQPQQPPPSLWEDEQGWQQHFGQEVVATATQQAALNARLDMSEMMVAQSQPDFDDVRPKILEFMGQNPTLKDEILGDRHPWLKAYNMVKNHERMTQLAAVDVTELETKLRAEIEAKLKAELQPQAPAPAIPDSLADAQSARGSSAAFSPPSLDDILKR